MKKALVSILILFLSISLIGCTGGESNSGGELHKQAWAETQNDEAIVNSVVEEFGQKLQLVSLLGPEDVLEKSMQENYGEYVSPSLIEQWFKDPINAPGRLTSSPWPDRIEILSTEKVSEGAYEVMGEIVEIAGGEKKEIVAKRTITLLVEITDGKWLISDTTIGECEDRN